MKKAIMIAFILVFGISVGIIIRQAQQTAHYKKVEGYNIVGRIEITKDFINVREQPSTKAAKVFEALKGEQYDVIEVFEEESGVYNWYKIVFSDRRIGWVASYKEDSWVKEIK